MPGLPSLPRHRSGAWPGGFVIDSPVYTASIAASGGLVVAATERIYRMRPGATHFEARPVPPNQGDVVRVAVEPRPHGRPARFAVATLPRALHVFHGKGTATVEFPEDHGEIRHLLWATRIVEGKRVACLHVRFADVRLVLVPDGGPVGTLIEDDWPARNVHAMATDGAGGFAYAVFDEDTCEYEVGVLADLASDTWLRGKFEAPSMGGRVRLAVAGTALALSFEGGGVWLTRDPREQPLAAIESLGGVAAAEGGGEGAAIAFEGTSADAALFAAVRETRQRAVIVRVDAEGRHERIAEMTVEEDETKAGAPEAEAPRIEEMAWDATRRTLWCAAGRAGVMSATAPGAKVPFGQQGGKGAAS